MRNLWSLIVLVSLCAVSQSVIDWTTRFLPVQDQGRCNASWAFAAAALYEATLAIETNSAIDISEEYLIECSNQGSCAGGSVAGALKWLALNGAPLASQYPYTAYNYTRGRPETPGICNSSNRILSSRNIKVEEKQKISNRDLKNVVKRRPTANLITSVEAFAYHTGSLELICLFKGRNYTGTLNHSVNVVGYDNKNFIVRNSQGTLWGNGGYATVKRNKDCGLR